MIVFDESSDSDNDQPPPKKVKIFKPPEAKETLQSISALDGLESIVAKDDQKEQIVNCEPSNDSNASNDDFLNMELESDEETFKKTQTSQLFHKNSLSKSILNENSVGFKMMQMMGFKPNGGLGVENNPNAIKEPISVTKRKSRMGIGSKKSKTIVLQPINSESTKRFHNTSKEAFEERKKVDTITKLQKFCYEESKESIETSDDEITNVNPLWRDYVVERCGDQFPDLVPNNDQQSPSTDAKLNLLLEYARSNFFYCIYCGIKYANEDEILQQCPGQFRESHPF